MKKILEYMLKCLAFFWQKIIPILLIIAFAIGVFYHLWDVMQISIVWSSIITVSLGAVMVFGFGKIIKLW